MSNSGEIKFKVLPRGNEPGAPGKKKPEPSAPAPSKRMIIYVGTVAISLILLGSAFYSPKKRAAPPKTATKKSAGKSEMASINGRTNELVTRHLQETEIQREMMMRQREIENQAFKDRLPNAGEEEQLPDTSNYGVSFDSDDPAKRVYEDTHDETQGVSADLPADKIAARLANREWVNQMERAEKIQFISNFIRTAYDRGYEVEIDSNLRVVGVKPIKHDRILNIDQVIDRIAKGQEPSWAADHN